jgi:PAS domain S-box-containing protein
MLSCKVIMLQVLTCLLVFFIFFPPLLCLGKEDAVAPFPPSSLQQSQSATRTVPLDVSPSIRRWLDSLAPVRLGVDAHLAPLEFVDDNNQYQGMSSAYMRYFFDRLGLNMAQVEPMNWSEVIERGKQHQVDIIPLIAPTPGRQRYFLFTKPYVEFPQAIFTRQNNPYISGLEDLTEARLVIEKGYVTTDYLRNDYPGLDITEVDTTRAALEAVSYGRADAYVGSLLVGSYMIEAEGLTNLKVAAPAPYRIQLSIGIRKDWPLMVPLLNRIIDSITEADRAAIRHQWLLIQYDKRTDYGLAGKVLVGSALAFLLVLLRNRDIVRRKKQLEASEKQFKGLINTLPVALLVVDYEGNIIFDNAQAGRELGSEQSLIGRNSSEFYAFPDDRHKVLAMISSNKQLLSHHVKFRIDSGAIIDCLLSVLPIHFDGEDVLLAVTVNVTQRVKMEQALAEAKRHAEEADHLKSAFLASMSHELRTPLNSIIGFTGILLQELAGPLSKEQHKQLSMVQGSSRHLLALINDVLDISKIEAGELKVYLKNFDLREVVDKVVQSMLPLAEQKKLELLVDVASDVQHIYSDSRRVEQVLINLVANAIKFTEKGTVSIACRIEGDSLRVQVHDSGSGIQPGDMDKLFQTFQQIDTGLTRRHEGTGLGLSISKKLVERLGGTIKATSTWGQGSTFTFYLPVKQR